MEREAISKTNQGETEDSRKTEIRNIYIHRVSQEERT
jgi:hypothetical protein